MFQDGKNINDNQSFYDVYTLQKPTYIAFGIKKLKLSYCSEDDPNHIHDY